MYSCACDILDCQVPGELLLHSENPLQVRRFSMELEMPHQTIGACKAVSSYYGRASEGETHPQRTSKCPQPSKYSVSGPDMYLLLLSFKRIMKMIFKGSDEYERSPRFRKVAERLLASLVLYCDLPVPSRGGTEVKGSIGTPFDELVCRPNGRPN